MDKDKLKEILENHRKWLNDRGGARADLTRADLTDANLTNANLMEADLTGADLTGADLTDANLMEADLTGADLTRADLTGADLDFSVLPLWCGSFGMKVDRNIYTQILYHLCRLDVDDEECREHQKMSMELANKADVRERHNLREIE
jgi:hypothetical protein